MEEFANFLSDISKLDSLWERDFGGDIVDDFVQLGIINPNWRRFGKPGYMKKKRAIKELTDASR